MLTAILAALAVVLSTSCASSRHIRNQRSLVNGVGSTCQAHEQSYHPPGVMLDYPQEAAAVLQYACRAYEQCSVQGAVKRKMLSS